MDSALDAYMSITKDLAAAMVTVLVATPLNYMFYINATKKSLLKSNFKVFLSLTEVRKMSSSVIIRGVPLPFHPPFN